MENNEKYSIIVPAYKCEKFLDRCVESILAQTYGNFELILVDDCSPDTTPQMCDDYAARDPRIRVIHQPENKGVSTARNTGIAASTGDFIVFIDSDDYIEKEMLADCLEAARTHDMVWIPFVFDWTEAGRENVPGEFLWDECANHKDIQAKEYQRIIGLSPKNVLGWNHGEDVNKGRALGMSWQFVYRAGLVRDNGIAFCPDLYFKEDEIFLADCLCYAESLTKMDKVYYNYYQNAGSAVHNLQKNYNRMLDNKRFLLREKNRIRDFIRQRENLDIQYMYAGSNVLSAIEIAFLAVMTKRGYGVFREYVRNAEIRTCVKMIPLECNNPKFNFMLLLMKLRLMPLMYFDVKIFTLFGINPYKRFLNR